MLVVLYARTYRLSTPFLKKSRFFIIFLYESLCDWHSLDDAVRENDNAAAQALRGTKACRKYNAVRTSSLLRSTAGDKNGGAKCPAVKRSKIADYCKLPAAAE